MSMTSSIALYAAIVSTYAALVSTGALLWQVLSWKKSGPLIQVRARTSGTRWADGSSQRVIEIEAFNKGREPIEIMELGINFRVKERKPGRLLRSRVDLSVRPDEEFPCTIEGGHGFSSAVDIEDLGTLYYAMKIARPYVKTRDSTYMGKFIGRRETRHGKPTLRHIQT